jgi:hypothetical protein
MVGSPSLPLSGGGSTTLEVGGGEATSTTFFCGVELPFASARVEGDNGVHTSFNFLILKKLHFLHSNYYPWAF